jgi:uncharacterized protein involved in outer membrane biogenesis
VGLSSAIIVRAGAVVGSLRSAVEQQTGAKFSYSSALGFAFWPKPAVILGDVSLSSSDDKGELPLITASEMRIETDQAFVLPTALTITRVSLFDMRVNLRIDRDGKANWAFSGRGDASPAEAEARIPIRLGNGKVSFEDQRSGLKFVLDEVEAEVTTAGPDNELTAKGNVVWNLQPVKFELFLKSPRRATQEGSPIDLNIVSPSLTAGISGMVMTARGLDLSGQATAQSPDLTNLARWFGTRLSIERGLKDFQISGALEASSKAISFTKSQFSVDAIHGQGDLAFIKQNERVRIDGQIGVDQIDLNAYQAAESRMPLLSLLEEPWATGSMSFAGLTDIDARLKIATGQIVFGDLKTGAARVGATLEKRVLDLKLDDVSLYGGLANAEVRLDGSQDIPSLAIAFAGNDLDSNRALRGALSLGKISGKLSTTFSASTSGTSVAEMVSRLTGAGSFRITEGSIMDMDLVGMIRAVTQEIQRGWPIDPTVSTAFEALSASYIIDEGIVSMQNLVLSGPVLSIASHGEIDLARQAFDLTSDPRIPTAANSSGAREFTTLPVPVVVKGPWIGPNIYPDMPGILDDPAAAFRALKKLGLGTATIEAVPAPSAN